MQLAASKSRLSLALAATSTVLLLVSGPAASATSSTRAAVRHTEERLLVKFQPTASATEVKRTLAAAGATEAATIRGLGVRVARVPAGSLSSALRSLRSKRAVLFAEQDARVAPSDVVLNDFRWRDSWALPKIHAPKAWGITTGNSQVIVAVLDSGVDFQQPDLQGAFVPGRDIYNNDADPSDDNGHGTGAAGVVAARSDNGVGVTSICGSCSIMPVKIAGSDGYATSSTMASGITWAVDHGARILTISFASPTSSSTVASAIQYARNHNALVFASAGNYSSSAAYYPAASPGAIAVAATSESDSLESYSNYGSWVQLAAPGCNYSTLWTAKYSSNPYNLYCGTSSAAPAAAGIAALALSRDPSVTADQLEQALYNGATPVGSFVKYGRADAFGTMKALGATEVVAPNAPAPRAAEEPVQLVWPGNALAGAPQPGQILAASTGGWTGALPMSFTWTWSRCDSIGASCATVSVGTSSTYTVSTADTGYALRVSLTASNSFGLASSTSAPSLLVAGSPGPATAPTVTSPPVITGIAQEGQILSASTGAWNGSPTAYGYQWQRCDGLGNACAVLAGATAASYTATSADVGATLRVAVTASNGAGSATAISSPTVVVAAAPSSTTTTTTYSGSINTKRPSQSFDVSLPNGSLRADLAFTKCNQLGLELRTAAGSVKSAVGPSVVTMATQTSAGAYSFVVSGNIARGSCSFTLTVSASG
jgi:subtilisin family serine protease